MDPQGHRLRVSLILGTAVARLRAERKMPRCAGYISSAPHIGYRLERGLPAREGYAPVAA